MSQDPRGKAIEPGSLPIEDPYRHGRDHGGEAAAEDIGQIVGADKKCGTSRSAIPEAQKEACEGVIHEGQRPRQWRLTPWRDRTETTNQGSWKRSGG